MIAIAVWLRSGAKLMVAINNHARSPVFEQVDIGVVEECQSFLPILIGAIKARRQKGLTC